MEVHFLSCVGTNTEENLTRRAAVQPARGRCLLHVGSVMDTQGHMCLLGGAGSLGCG